MINKSARNAAPVLVGPEGATLLERIELAPQGAGTFDEAWLQRLIHDNPECLPIAEIEPGLDPFTAICREMPLPTGVADNLLMSGAGDIAIVETKLFRNPESRRKVVGQILDYATCLFGMGYMEFERAILKGAFSTDQKPSSLYEALPDADKLSEPSFIDAVSRNLAHGNILLLVVGDGIHSETEALVNGLKNHSRYGFRMALIEMGVFRMPGTQQFLVRLRTLAKTEIIQRVIIEIAGGASSVKQEKVHSEVASVTANRYWQDLESKAPGAQKVLEAFIRAVEPIGVYLEVLGSLNLKWQRPGSKPVNLVVRI